jgi:hypothetical protein
MVVSVLFPVRLAAAEPETKPRIDPKADEILKAMSKELAGLKEFTLTAEETHDDVQDNGQKLQFSNRRTVQVRRPSRLAGTFEGDTAQRQVAYDGQTLTLYDRGRNVYGIIRVPSTIEAMLDHLHEKFAISLPLSDLFFGDPHKVLTENVETGSYVGLHQVGGVKCHHLAFTQDRIDWQIWVDAGAKPLPRKFLITYKRLPGEPQYAAVLQQWDTSPKFDEATFQFKPPAGAMKIDLVGLPLPLRRR